MAFLILNSMSKQEASKIITPSKYYLLQELLRRLANNSAILAGRNEQNYRDDQQERSSVLGFKHWG
jgi:hypothetical protein